LLKTDRDKDRAFNLGGKEKKQIGKIRIQRTKRTEGAKKKKRKEKKRPTQRQGMQEKKRVRETIRMMKGLGAL